MTCISTTQFLAFDALAKRIFFISYIYLYKLIKVVLLREPAETTREVLEDRLNWLLNGPDRNVNDVVVIYLSCHGGVYGRGHTFYLLPSDAKLERDGMPKKTTVIDIHHLTSMLSGARMKNIIFFLDVCHSGGAGITLQHLNLSLNPDINLFIIGAARHDQVTAQSSALRHGIFTHHLLEAFEQKPQRDDGWLTISQIIGFVAESIKAEGITFPQQENPLQVQIWSTSVDPNIFVSKNPRYSPQSREFYEEVKRLLALVQYEPIETTLPKGAPARFYVAEIKSGFDTDRVGVMPYYNGIEALTPTIAEKLAYFAKEQMEMQNLYKVILVTVQEVSKEVQITLQSSGIRNLKTRTYTNIWKNLIDFNKYLQGLVSAYYTPIPEQRDTPPLGQVYIPLIAAKYSEHEVKVSQTNGMTTKSSQRHQVVWQGDLEDEVKRWLVLNKPAEARLVLLAGYGGGKSTFCQHLAATLARSYLVTPEHERSGYRIPLLIPLRSFAKNPVELESYLVAHLKQYCGVSNADAQALMKMAEAGMLLFILDGFDEMASRATTDTVRQNIELFERLVNIPHNKVLVTTRPEYFFTLNQEQDVLQAYSCLYLQPFSEKQVNHYLQKRVPFLRRSENEAQKHWTYYRTQIEAIHDLSDLVRRPVLLEMIVKTLPVLVIEGEAVNRPNLYQRYLEGELDRQFLKQRRDLLIDRQKRFEIMKQIAIEMYQTDKVELTGKRILEISQELLTLEQREEMEGSLREIVTCSFLIRTGDEYGFSHQSFLEYLVACHLAQDITDNRLENLRQKPLTPVIRGFLLELEIDAVQKGSISRGLALGVNFDRKKLESLFCANPRDVYVSSNAVSLLAKLLPHDRFSQLPLHEANLTGANLTGANLSRAKLSRTNFSNANLSGATVLRRNLNEAILEGANLQNLKEERSPLADSFVL